MRTRSGPFDSSHWCWPRRSAGQPGPGALKERPLQHPEQMACCGNEQHACGHHGLPAECCKTAPQASVSTAAVHDACVPTAQVETPDVDALAPVPFAASWYPRPLTDTWSPPGKKHPTYLVLFDLRL